MFNFKPQKIQNYLSQGTYQGYVEKLQYFEEKGYFVMDILVDDQIFNTAFSVKSIVFNNYASNFVDESGCLDETQIIDTEVKFTVVDNKTSGKVKSRVTSLEAVS